MVELDDVSSISELSDGRSLFDDGQSDLYSQPSFSYDVPDTPQPVPLPLSKVTSRTSYSAGDGRTSRTTTVNTNNTATQRRDQSLPRKASMNVRAADAKFGGRLRTTDLTAPTAASLARARATPTASVKDGYSGGGGTLPRTSGARAPSRGPGAAPYSTVRVKPSVNSMAGRELRGSVRAQKPPGVGGKTWI